MLGTGFNPMTGGTVKNRAIVLAGGKLVNIILERTRCRDLRRLLLKEEEENWQYQDPEQGRKIERVDGFCAEHFDGGREKGWGDGMKIVDWNDSGGRLYWSDTGIREVEKK